LLATLVTVISAAEAPYTILHSLFDPSTNTQVAAGQGAVVAVDGNFAVVGAARDDEAGLDSGVVKVYDATTGARLPMSRASMINGEPALM